MNCLEKNGEIKLTTCVSVSFINQMLLAFPKTLLLLSPGVSDTELTTTEGKIGGHTERRIFRKFQD